jgi:hypothetical protein
MRRKIIAVGVVGCLAALIVAGVSVGQPQGRTGQRGGQRGMFDPAQMRQMMDQRMKEQLGCTDQEWQVLGPRVTKVMNLTRQTGMGAGMGRMSMGRRGQGGPGGPGGQRGQRGQDGQGGQDGQQGRRPRGPEGQEETALSSAADALRTTLENASAAPDDIKAKLTALRTVKEKARQELATAQKELREVLSLRQEAQLVLMGMLN